MPTWNTSSDWDSATSEDGVVHESVANTDHDDAGSVKRGYSVASPYRSSSLVLYLPLHEDSGSTAYDFSGNNYDATINGASVNQPGLLNTTSYDFDGNGDDIKGNSSFADSSFTITCWFNTDATSEKYALFNVGKLEFYFTIDNGGLGYQLNDGSWINSNSGTLNTGTWYFGAVTWNSGTATVYLDGSELFQNSHGSLSSDSANYFIGESEAPDWTHYNGSIQEVRYYNYALSSSEIQTLYDVVNTDGTITTDYRTG